MGQASRRLPRTRWHLWLGLLAACAAPPPPGPAGDGGSMADLVRLSAYDLEWHSPSGDASGSMPIGNGEVGCNVWVDGAAGELVLLVARTDSFSEASRLLKLGRVRVRLFPNPFGDGRPFRQTLVLRDGCIRVRAGAAGETVALQVFVDAEADVIHLTGRSDRPITMTAIGETWRTEEKVLTGEELRSSWTMQEAPAGVRVVEAADQSFASGGPDVAPAVGWLHRNEHSVVPLTMQHQSLTAAVAARTDPLLHRTFGCRIEGDGFAAGPAGPSATGGAAGALHRTGTDFALRIAAPCVQHRDPGFWHTRARELLAAADPGAAERRTAAWWRAFWARSHVFVGGDDCGGFGVPRNDHPLRIGVDSAGGNRFVGEIAEVQVRGRDHPEPLFQARPGSTLPHVAVGHRGLDLGRGFTIEATVQQEPGHPVGRIVDKVTAGQGDGFLFDTHPGSALRLIVGDRELVVPDALPPGERHRVTAGYSGDTGWMGIFRNGQLLAESAGRSGDDPAPPSRLTQALVLQRWVQACGGRGDYPIKFNGSIFTVEPRFTGGQPFDADWRRWGDCFWWQNTRLPYHPMLAQGDFEMLEPLFRLYERNLQLCRERAVLYHGVRGAYFPETMTMFGTYANRDYGWDRTGHAPNEVLCPWWQWCWVQGLELVALMLDRHDYAPDLAFARDRLLPMADEVLAWFDTRFPRDERGVLRITPTQALETWWEDVVNDLPTVAGLHAVLNRLLAQPDALVFGERRWRWQRLRDSLPAIPVRQQDGVTMLAPAERHEARRRNVETPELYSLFPFRLHGLGRPGLELAAAAYDRRHERRTDGWTQDGQFAALLGRVDDAVQNVRAKVRNSNPKHRFPAMWGPNFDWLPDQCHGSNLLHVVQLMLLQPVGDQLLVLPCWPKDWDVAFRLRAPGNTVVEVEYRRGVIERLEVTPPARRADVVLPAGGDIGPVLRD